MSDLDPYDAVLLTSFGGPESVAEVMPFLQHVTGGRGVPQERLVEVAHHYEIRDGRSPLPEENRRLVAALGTELDARGTGLPIALGNRHAAPFTVDALRELHARGARTVLALVTSAYPSYSGCRQYREDLADALVTLADEGRPLRVDKVRPYADHPGFVDAVVELTVAAAIELLQRHSPRRPHLACVTHSIPTTMAHSSGPGGEDYLAMHAEIAQRVADAVRTATGVDWQDELVYCSRSGPPSQPWLEPDIVDHLGDVAAQGVDAVLVSPIGFVADHMEVVHDLDTEAAQAAADLGVAFARAPTVRDDPTFVRGLADLLAERAAQARGEDVEPASVIPTGPLPAACDQACCPNPRAPRPAACSRPEGETR